ncbi:hypothetical protein GKR55_13495 [Providencia stuartii]|nr:hypothetical protein [Providencia stuartii]MTB81515.1 hypothetical protein [Providencia stuartii]
MSQSNAAKLSFFRLPAIFVSVWILTEYLWFYSVTIQPLLYAPPHYLNSIIYGLRVEWFIKIFIFLLSTCLIFYYTKLNQANLKNILIVAGIAIVYFFILKFTQHLSGIVMNKTFGGIGLYHRPSLVYAYRFSIIVSIINVLILILLFIPRIFFCKKARHDFVLTKKNHGLIYNALYIITMLCFTLVITFITVYSIALFKENQLILKGFLLLSYQASDMLFPATAAAIVIFLLSIYRSIPFQGSQLKVKRLMLLSFINTIILLAIMSLLAFLLYLSIKTNQQIATLDKFFVIVGIVIFIIIARLINKRVFRTKKDSPTITPTA